MNWTQDKKMLLRICMFLIPCLYLHIRTIAPASVDTINPSQPLKDGAVLMSSNGAFALGFFSPANSTTRRYVGIWYAKVSVQTVVWVANRGSPIDGPAGVLSVDNHGRLILSGRQGTVWSTSTNSSLMLANSTSVAQLLDSGNLVLWNAAAGSARTVSWQSFDHPTHAFLPGMRLGLDRRTGLIRFLTSWRSADDPGPGNYTFRVDPDGLPEFLLFRGSNPVWRTGPWIGQRWSGVPEMTRAYIFNYSFINSPDEVSVTYSVLSPAVTSVFLLDGGSGTVQRRTWHGSSGRWTTFWSAPAENCDQYGKCGVFGVCDPNSGGQFECSCLPGYSPRSARDWYLRDATEGCARSDRNVSMCGNGEGFVLLSSVKAPVTSRARADLGMSWDDCRKECLKNCSCSGFMKAGAGGVGGCVMLYGDLMDTREYPNGEGEDVYVRVDAVELARSRNKSKGLHAHKKLLVILLVCATLVALMAVLSFMYLRKKNTSGWGEEKEISLWLKETEESETKNSNLPIFGLDTIVASTENFSLGNKLGEGGFGSVYKGKLSSGREIAVKRLAKNSGQGMQEFKNEVQLVAKLQHRNLVKTLGCCAWGEERMLIYEYLPNKSLDYYIFDEEKRQLLDWKKRYDIIVGIARGLVYLHQDSRLRIIHRDLKTSNVLLDAEMTPKISDFGMARIFGSDEIQANTNRVVGTYGYMSPEYAMQGLFSIKSDVFSYGVLTIEMITGKKSSGYYNYELATNLIGHVWKLWQESKARDIVDPTILTKDGPDHVDVVDEEEILRCMQVGLLCVQENPNDRPTMSEVAIMLSSNTSAQLSPPKQPAFVIRAAAGRQADGSSNTDPSSSSSAAGAYSINEVTDTSIQGR